VPGIAATCDDKGSLRAQLCRKGYRCAAVLGPFAARQGPPEYTVTLYDATGRSYLATRRGTPRALWAWIEALPDHQDR
jgi:hypothetical protein